MHRQSFSKMAWVSVPLVVLSGVLVSGASVRPDARGDARDRNCSNRTLRGDYGSAIEGTVLPAPGVSLPIRGVVMTRYDGEGNFHQVDHVVVNGVPPPNQWNPGAGTYQINADCTGTGQILQANGGFVNLVFVVVRSGDEVHAVVTAPFDGPARTVSSVGIRVD